MITIEYALKLTGGVSTAEGLPLSGNIKEKGIVLTGDVAVANGSADPYVGPYEVTPTKQTQTLSAADKLMTEDVIVNPIPDLYIDTTISEYGAAAAQILNGYKGYVNDYLVTGSAEMATATVEGTKLILTNGFPISV